MSATPSTPPAGLPASPSVSSATGAPGANCATDAPGAYACLLALLEVLVLSLLLRLPGRQAALLRRTLARRAEALAAALAPDAAPHVTCIALGLIPDWYIPCRPGRGMRCIAAPRPHVRTQAPARAPPCGVRAP